MRNLKRTKFWRGDQWYWDTYVRPPVTILGGFAVLIAYLSGSHPPVSAAVVFVVTATVLFLGPILLRWRRQARLQRHQRQTFASEAHDFRVALEETARGTNAGARAMAELVLRVIEKSWVQFDPVLRFNKKEGYSLGAGEQMTPAFYSALSSRILEPCAGETIVATLAEEIEQRSRTVAASLSVNTAHALVFDNDIEMQTATPYYPCRYSDLCAILQSVDAWIVDSKVKPSTVALPRVLGGGCLIVCAERDEIVLLRRSNEKVTHPGLFHVFGGNFEPFPLMGQGHDVDLRATSMREVREEAGLVLENVGETTVVTHLESADVRILTNTQDQSESWKLLMKNLPVHFCGVLLPRDRSPDVMGYSSPEGTPVAIRLAELSAELKNYEQWVPAAWCTVMLWLWNGAPLQGGGSLCRPEQARAMAHDVLA